MDTPRTPVLGLLREQSSEHYRYFAGSQEVKLVNASRIDPVLIAQMKQRPERDRLFWLIEQVVSKRDLMIIDSLSQRDFERLVKAWFRHGGVQLGKLLGLIDLIESHTGALEYDLRTKLDIKGIREFLSDDYTWRERIQLVWGLGQHMDTMITASTQDWDRPWSQEWQILADIYDLQMMIAVGGKKMKESDRYESPLRKGKKQGTKLTNLEALRARKKRLDRLQPPGLGKAE